MHASPMHAQQLWIAELQHCTHQLLYIVAGVLHSRELRQATQITQTNDADTG